ncbi:MAG: hypothetical protein JOY90_31080 [Bradyrhizobium sp.]|nr:hypothetical protein [Bradyrhizobium sp.]
MSPDEMFRVVSGVELRVPTVGRGTVESDPDSALVALGRQFEALSAELAALQRGESPAPRFAESGDDALSEATTKPTNERIEAVLTLLDPIERAIMAMPAVTIVGLGVKARHAAHVLSHYWTDLPERLDWDARAVRLLIESTCIVAGVTLQSSDL